MRAGRTTSSSSQTWRASGTIFPLTCNLRARLPSSRRRQPRQQVCRSRWQRSVRQMRGSRANGLASDRGKPRRCCEICNRARVLRSVSKPLLDLISILCQNMLFIVSGPRGCLQVLLASCMVIATQREVSLGGWVSAALDQAADTFGRRESVSADRSIRETVVHKLHQHYTYNT